MNVAVLKTSANRVLKEARWKAGLTQPALAAKAEVAVSTIARLEAGLFAGPGGHTPRGTTIFKIAQALGLDPADLLETEVAS